MIEDVQYRQSSQYRYWSYTSQSLHRIRQETNNLASQRVRAAFQRARTNAAISDFMNGGDTVSNVNAVGTGDGGGGAAEIETLTVDEELKIVEWGCGMIVLMGEKMTPRLPSHVVVSLYEFEGADVDDLNSYSACVMGETKLASRTFSTA
jgi:cyclin H